MAIDGQVRPRSAAGRVAVPVQQAEPRPSLVPVDVWESWQRELATDDDASVEEILDYEEIITDTNAPSGLAASTQADFEVALFALGQVGLFADLERAALEDLARSARQGEVSSGDHLFREQEFARSFFVVLDGAVEILRRSEGREVALRHIGSGEAVGLFGLLSGQRRAACVRAIGDATVLEIPAEALNESIARHEGLRERVVHFYEERLLEGFVGSSRLFADVDAIARARIIGRFVERRLTSADTLVQPGEVSNLLAVVITGRLQVEVRTRPGEAPTLLELFPGEFIALTAAFSGAPSRLRVFAPDGATVVMLGHPQMAELLRDYPALRAISHRLPAAAATRLDRDVWCGHCAVPGL